MNWRRSTLSALAECAIALALVTGVTLIASAAILWLFVGSRGAATSSLTELLTGGSADPILPLLVSCQAIIMVLTGAILITWRIGRSTPVPRSRVGTTLAIGVGGGVVAVVASGLIAAGLEACGLPVEEQTWVRDVLGDPGLLARMAPWFVLLNPWAEEVLFRGYIFRRVGEAGGLVAAVLASSALFAVFHFNPSGIVIYFVIGCVLAWVYHRTQRLLAAVVAHVVNNALVLVFGIFAGPAGGA